MARDAADLMKTLGLAIAAVIACTTVFAQSPKPAGPAFEVASIKPAAAQGVPTGSAQTAAPIDPAAAAFGYTDDTGTKLLMLTNDGAVMDTARARAMETAVCSDSREIPIRYLQFQKRTAQSNGRQSAGNLKNDEGHLYEIAGAAADAGDTCLLVTASYLRRFPVVRNDFSLEQRTAREREATGAFAQASIARLQMEKGRGVTLYWLLHRVGASQEVAAVEFAAVGDSLLGSIVLAESGRLSFFDMPANRKDLDSRGGCWRIEDECRFNHEDMAVPAVLGAPGEQLVFLTTWGPEGQLVMLLQARARKLVEVRRAYRYHAPI